MSPKQVIESLGPRVFRVSWDGEPADSALTLDFSPFLPWLNAAPGCLLHWQAKPRGLRRWGVYDSFTDSYHGFDWDKLEVLHMVRLIPLQVNETVVKSVPTAVMYLPGCSFNVGLLSTIWRK